MLIPRNNEYDWFEDFLGDSNFQRKSNNLMKTDIKEFDGKYQLEIDVPGYNKEQLKIELNNGYLTVSAESQNDQNQDWNHYIHRERCYGKCSRAFYVGNKVDGEDIQANFKDGTLFINYPKNKENEKKIIDIQ